MTTSASSQPAPETLATWLLIGFKRGQNLREVLWACGFSKDVDFADLHERFPFMPAAAWRYSRPVRAFVAAEWPKLNAFLVANENDPEKMARLPAQLVRLVSVSAHMPRQSKADAVERAKDKRDYRAAAASYGLSRDAFKSNRRSAWNVCKKS
jgi:hypothetical protein